MALLDTLTLTANGTASVKLKNHRNNKPNDYTYIVTGGFGSGTIAVGVSVDDATYAPLAIGGAPLTFASAESETITINSDEKAPVYLGFTISGSTTPTVTISVYDTK